MKILTLIILLLGISYSQSIPTWGLGGSPPRGPGWSENAAGNLYPAGLTNSYGAYGSVAPAPAIYIASYPVGQSPTFPGYTPGLYGLGYLNLRGSYAAPVAN